MRNLFLLSMLNCFLILMTTSESSRAAELKVTDVEGQIFNLTNAHTVHYQPEGSMGGSGGQVAGIKARTARGNIMMPWKDIRSIVVSNRGNKGKMQMANGEEQEVTFGLQSLDGEMNGKEISLNFERITRIEVISP